MDSFGHHYQSRNDAVLRFNCDGSYTSLVYSIVEDGELAYSRLGYKVSAWSHLSLYFF